MNSQPCVVAIDGPAGSGKSTVSRRLAMALDAKYLDTGAMYRAATWAALRDCAELADPDRVAKVVGAIDLTVQTDPTDPQVWVDGTNVDREIRSPEVTAAVSAVAAIPAVREILVGRQRAIVAEAERIVVEGRDIGSVVTPNANLKVYLTASVAERARRRSVETAAELTATAVDIERRDRFDSTRALNPLHKAEDAVAVDTTGLSIDEVVTRLIGLLTVVVPA